MIQYYIRLAKLNDGTYRAWQKDKSSGQVIILSDENDYFYGKDISYVNSLTSDAQRWYILPVNTEDNYLGVKPNIEAMVNTMPPSLQKLLSALPHPA